MPLAGCSEHRHLNSEVGSDDDEMSDGKGDEEETTQTRRGSWDRGQGGGGQVGVGEGEGEVLCFVGGWWMLNPSG